MLYTEKHLQIGQSGLLEKLRSVKFGQRIGEILSVTESFELNIKKQTKGIMNCLTQKISGHLGQIADQGEPLKGTVMMS